MCAKEMKKPFYVLTESFKFSRIYPLNQVDLPDEFKVKHQVKYYYLGTWKIQTGYARNPL